MRNMVLHIEELEALGLEMSFYVVGMAEALAFLLWEAQVDAEGVEFVLAPSRVTAGGWPRGSLVQPEAEGPRKEFLGDHVLWMVDFDKCKRLKMRKGAVRRAAAAFLRNDPYFPRPGRAEDKDQVVWCMFRDQFLKYSEKMLGGRSKYVQRLPYLFVEEVARLVRVRQGRQDSPSCDDGEKEASDSGLLN